MSGLFDLHGDPFASAPAAIERPGSRPDAPGSRSSRAWPPPPLSSPAHVPAPSDSDTAPARFPSALRSLWTHRRVAIILFLLLAPAAVFAAHRKLRPTYRAETVLRISPIMPRLAYTGEEWRASSITGFYDDYVRTLTQLVAERSVLAPAIARLEGEGLAWRPESITASEAPNHLRARLDVKLVRDTELLTVALEDSDPRVVAPVVSAVTESFLARLAEEEALGNEAKVRTLLADRERLKTQLAEVHAKLDGLSGRLGSAILDERQNIFYQRIGVLDEGLTKLFVRRVEAEAALAGARARAVELGAPVPEALVQSAVEEDVAVRDARVLDVRLSRDLETAIQGYSPVHPLRAEAERRRARSLEGLRALEAEVARRARERLSGERSEEARALVAAAEREAEGARRSEALMQSVMDGAREGLAEYGRAMFEGSRLRAEAGRLLDALGVVERRIEELRVEARAPCRVSVRTAAVEPAKPVKDPRRAGFAGALAACAAVGLGAAIALGRVRPLVRDADELRAAGHEVLVEMGPADPRAASDALLRLEAGTGADRLRAVVVPADADPGAASAARRVAEALLEAAGARHEALLVRLAAEGPGAVTPQTAPDPEGTATAEGRTVRWGPLAAPEALSEVVASGAFRTRFESLAADADTCLVAAPSPLASAVSWPFFARGYQAVLVAAAGRTTLPMLASAADAVRRARGTVAGVVLVRTGP